MRPVLLLSAAVAAILLAAPADARAARYVPDEVIVKYREGWSNALEAKLEKTIGAKAKWRLPGGSRELEIDDGESVRETLRELRSDPKVEYAVPNYIARASRFIPNDPSFGLQWNFSGRWSINAPDAWTLARRAGAPGGKGAVVAVMDTGVAYKTRARWRRAPDLSSTRWVRGYDYIGGDRYPHDANGHGTHVAGTIGQITHNRIGVAGIAYRAKIMPLRVLDSVGVGDAASIARAIRFAARRNVDVINMSFQFDDSVGASMIPDVLAALRYARSRGVVVVAASGNQAGGAVAYPARSKYVIAVGATTVRGCQAEYSNKGIGIDVAAPGGGYDAANADNPTDARNCRPNASARDIFQQTFTSSVRTFGLPGGYEGTSMAAPHVSATAALIIATRRLGANPSPRRLELHLERTARDLGRRGYDTRYGYGLINAAAALRR
jgi:serine protease